MNIKLYNAAMTQLRGKAMESLALIDMLLNNPTMVPDHSSLVEEIMVHSQTLAEYEGSMLTLQQYFAPQNSEQRPPSPGPMPPGANPPMAKSKRAPIREDELIKTSPTFRNSQRNQKNQKKAEKKTAETT